MGVGIKLSKCGMFNINYHYFPESGIIIMPTNYDTEYILGVGVDKLADAKHNDVWVSELSANVKVYLENETTVGVWNTDYSGDKFSNPIAKIDDSAVGDFDLYAKWSQFVYKKIDSYTTSKSQSGILLSKNDLLFSWNDGGTTPSYKVSKAESNIQLSKNDLLFSWKE